MIIRHGENAATLTLDNYPISGTRTTPYKIYWSSDPNNPSSYEDIETLSPNYSSGGVYYTFTAGGTSTSSNIATLLYGNTIVTADYYLVATDTTDVQPVYVHNYNWFIDSLSISFGYVGFSINTDDFTDIMEGQTMSLKGYSSRIEDSILTIEPDEYDFAAQYYFYEKTAEHSLDGWDFTTTRLRCGYIEEQYINLSPNRANAGEAYLEFTFDKLVYEVDTNLSFWSSNENLTASSGDTAYIQYLDSSGNWITCLDLLDCDLSTDRTDQDYFEIEILEGTYGIRFIATKSNPTTSRNKGRICIGETKVVNYEIN